MKPRARLARIPARFVVRCPGARADSMARGCVMLPAGCNEATAGAALAAIGVSAPQGLDTIRWSRDLREALVRGVDGEILVQLTRDDVTRSARLAAVRLMYRAQLDTTCLPIVDGRFLLVQHDSVTQLYWLSAHDSFDDVHAYVDSDDSGYEAHELLDLDTGDAYAPVVSVRFERCERRQKETGS